MDIQNVIHIKINGIVLVCKNEGKSAICDNMDQPHRHYTTESFVHGLLRQKQNKTKQNCTQKQSRLGLLGVGGDEAGGMVQISSFKMNKL